MAHADGTVLFHRGAGDEEECDSDVWDDTALIAAYDAAVAPLKAKLAEHTGDSTLLEGIKKTTDSGQNKKKKNRKKKANKQAKKKQQVQMGRWSVGDNCQAVFTEDGVIYEARITSINAEENTCIVRYLGYGNEEEQSLEDLIRPDRSAHKQRRSNSVSLSETDSVSSASQKAGKRVKASKGPWSLPSYPGFGQGSNLHQPPPPPPLFSGMPSHPSFNMPQPPSAASMPFPMMPPPPPPMPDDSVSNENEALCSMLLSWYMSGYHTGFYQGMRQGRQQQDISAAMGPSR